MAQINGHASGTFVFYFPEMVDVKNREKPKEWWWEYSRERNGRPVCNC